jgi:hypothetical protein
MGKDHRFQICFRQSESGLLPIPGEMSLEGRKWADGHLTGQMAVFLIQQIQNGGEMGPMGQTHAQMVTATARKDKCQFSSLAGE